MDFVPKKHVRDLFGKVKRAVRFFLMHADKFPLIPDDPMKYKDVLRRTAIAAEEWIRSSLGFEDKKITIYTLANLPNSKDIEKTLKLPPDTPSDWCKFFK